LGLVKLDGYKWYGYKDVGASGGYADNIMRYAAKQLFNVELKDLEYKVKRKPDYKEIKLEVNIPLPLPSDTISCFTRQFIYT
jgi:hypothetical protein